MNLNTKDIRKQLNQILMGNLPGQTYTFRKRVFFKRQ